MKLEIANPIYENLDDFCLFLIREIQKRYFQILDKNKLSIWQDWLDMVFEQIDFNIFEILDICISNLIFRKQQSNYIISINSNINIPETSAKFIDIARAVNYGVLGYSAYPIFSDLFDYFAENFFEYKEKYEKLGLM